MTDQPIDGTALRPDLLHRSEFAARVASALIRLPPDESLVAAIEGSWGAGKTSVFNLIERWFTSPECNDSPIIIRFNPWMFSGVGNLITEFLVQFGTALNLKQSGKRLKKVGDELVRYSAIFDVLKFVPGAEPWASIAKGVFHGSGDAAGKVGDIKTLNAEAQRDAVIAAIRKTKKRFVVMIDDIDRLDPKGAYSMLQLVKAVSDFPRVIYLIGYSRSSLEKALDQVGIPESSVFLEKIVQLRVPLPRIAAGDAKEFLNRSLRGFGESDAEFRFPDEAQRWNSFAIRYIIPLLKNPRDFIRLGNRLRINYSLVEGEIGFSDYCALELIAVLEPAIYDHIKENPQVYIGIDPQDVLASSPIENFCKSERDKVLATIDDLSRRSKLDELLNELFPFKGMKESNYYSSWSSPPRSSGRIANPENFELAFYYSRPANFVPLSDLWQIWSNPDERWKVMSELAEGERGVHLLRLIDELLCNNGEVRGVQKWDLPEHVPNFVKCYSRMLNLECMPQEVGGFFDPDLMTYLRRIGFWLLKRVDDGKRYEFAVSICSDTDSLPVSTLIVMQEIWKRNKKSESGEHEDDKKFEFFEDREFGLIRDMWIDAFNSTKTSQTFYESKALKYVLTCALMIERSDLVEQILVDPKISVTNRALALGGLLSGGSINGRATLVADEKWLSSKFDFSMLQRVAEEVQSQLLDDNRLISVILKCFSNPSKRYYLDTGKESERF